MRKVCGVISSLIAGFFVYMLCLLAFVNQPGMAKWGILAGFSVPFLIFMGAGLALNRFVKWKRQVGVVLLSGVGVAVFIVFTFICLLMSEEYKKMMHPGNLNFFSAYAAGCTFMLIAGALGLFFLKSEKAAAEPGPEAPPSTNTSSSDEATHP